MAPPGGVIELPFEDDALRVADEAIRAQLETFITRAQLEQLLSLAHELVRGALRGRPPLLLRVAISPDRAHIQVSVTESSQPRGGDAEQSPLGPDNLLLDIGARWGVEDRQAEGRRWWVEVDA